MKDDLVIIRVDGGIASQIAFVTLRLAFEEKGAKVKYDLSWFEECGKGFFNPSKSYDKAYDVSFDVLKAFPSLSLISPFEIASKAEAKHYAKHYFIDDKDVIMRNPPLYVGGYLGRAFDTRYARLLREHFKPKSLVYHSSPSFFHRDRKYNVRELGRKCASCTISVFCPPPLSPSSKEMRRLIRVYIRRKMMQVLEKLRIKRFANDSVS